jgi:hypothetical protein
MPRHNLLGCFAEPTPLRDEHAVLEKNHLSTLEVVWRQSRQKTGSTDALKVSILQKLPKIIQNKEHPYQKKRI